MRRPKIIRATDVPSDDQSIGSLCAYEIDANRVEVACRLSDVNFEVGQLAILEVDLSAEPTVRETYIVDQFFAAFHAASRDRGLLVETGNIIHRRSDGIWRQHGLNAEFLQEAYSFGAIDFVFGDNGEIFRFQGGEWSRDETPTEHTVLGMHGREAGSLFAVGEHGLLMQQTDARWTLRELPTNVFLRTCLAVPDGSILVGGDAGMLAEIRDEELLPISDGLEGDVLSLCEFKGQTYVADSDFGVSVLNGAELSPLANLGYVYRLTAGEHWLTADAGEFVFQYDGKKWRGFEMSYSEGYRATPFDMGSIGL